MRLLLDTNVLLWAVAKFERLSSAGQALLGRGNAVLVFSPINLWEVAIKHALDRPDFRVDPRVLRRGLLENGYVELPVTSDHALAVALLPALHKDPFDRLLVAQALAEGMPFVTADAQLASYPGDIRLV